MGKAALMACGERVKSLTIVGTNNGDRGISEYGSLLGTPEEAGDIRKISGDLVLDRETGELCLDDGWLWDWERGNPKSYAWKMLLMARRRAEAGIKPPWYRPTFEERMEQIRSQRSQDR